ncbi:MAG: hypothetical protein GWP91_19435 [Rhodobacterales bacterium]|nr:hypothetical protein [Rhodobacterales bacterium]
MLRPVTALSLAALMFTLGCAPKNTQTSAGEDMFDNMVREKSVGAQGLIRQSIDFDGDEDAEIYNFFRERADAARLLVRKELDLNRDGKMDVVSFFDDDGNLEKEEMDGDYDGVFDWTDHYQKGIRVMSEYDTDNDGRANVFKYYDIGADGIARIDRKERDTDGDGKIDIWERFNADGEVIRTGRDIDGDGKMDVREE